MEASSSFLNTFLFLPLPLLWHHAYDSVGSWRHIMLKFESLHRVEDQVCQDMIEGAQIFSNQSHWNDANIIYFGMQDWLQTGEGLLSITSLKSYTKIVLCVLFDDIICVYLTHSIPSGASHYIDAFNDAMYLVSYYTSKQPFLLGLYVFRCL